MNAPPARGEAGKASGCLANDHGIPYSYSEALDLGAVVQGGTAYRRASEQRGRHIGDWRHYPSTTYLEAYRLHYCSPLFGGKLVRHSKSRRFGRKPKSLLPAAVSEFDYHAIEPIV